MENIGWIEKFTKGLSKNEFLTNVEKQYAVMKAIEVIGEAVKNLSLVFRYVRNYFKWFLFYTLNNGRCC